MPTAKIDEGGVSGFERYIYGEEGLRNVVVARQLGHDVCSAPEVWGVLVEGRETDDAVVTFTVVVGAPFELIV